MPCFEASHCGVLKLATTIKSTEYQAELQLGVHLVFAMEEKILASLQLSGGAKSLSLLAVNTVVRKCQGSTTGLHLGDLAHRCY